ncbi:MAG: sulfatase/phosphatase domain-containing protein, partial [Verrucomicrobiota bacterium]
DGGHRVPLFLHWPAGGMNQKKVVDRLVHAVDVVPTLLDLCGASKPADLKFDGTSIKPLLAGDGTDWPDRFVVTDSQRVVDPVKWRKTSVMSEEWRLVNGTELYHIDKDPGQTTNVAADHPEQVAEMTKFYDAWWAELEPTFSQTTELYLGHPDQEAVVSLTGHDWISDTVSPPWNQGHIRKAAGAAPPKPKKNQNAEEPQPRKHDGHWAIKVVTEGEYDIALRRWPAEADHPIVASLPAGKNVPGSSTAFRANDGIAIPVIKATLRINGEDLESKPVGESDSHVTFTTMLPEGSHQLSPVFHLENGNELGAYYTVVTKK